MADHYASGGSLSYSLKQESIGWFNQREKVLRNSPVQALIALEHARRTDLPTFLAMWVKCEPVKR